MFNHVNFYEKRKEKNVYVPDKYVFLYSYVVRNRVSIVCIKELLN